MEDRIMGEFKTESVLLRAARKIKQGGRLSRDDDQEAWNVVCQLLRDCTPLATMFISVCEELEQLRIDRDALMAVLDPLLVAVEPVRTALMQDIDSQVEAKQEWAKHYNATCGSSNEMWFYSTEFRRSLERELEPFTKAIREANEVYDRIESKEVKP